MCGVMRHFAKENKRELFACDINKDLIIMWNAVQNEWKPPLTCTEEYYNKLKNDKIHSPERGFIGFVASFGNNFFHAYRLHYKTNKNYMQQGYDGIMKVKNDIKNVNFQDAESYNNFLPSNMLIYSDPPYRNNKLSSKLFKNFDSDKFWQTMREWSKNNVVIISESSSPNDFIEIWKCQSRFTNKYLSKKYNDCLYIHKDIYQKLNKDCLDKISLI